MTSEVRPFRFGVSLLATGSRAQFQDKARQAEELGYDVIQVPDHLGMSAPFPTMVSAADATSLRVGTYVLNTAFYRPALLARDVADTMRLTDGRLELGLGTGYVEAEFTAAGLPFESGGRRVDNVAQTVRELRHLLADQQQPMPPLLLAGTGNRMLTLAAQEADIVGFPLPAGITPGLEPEKALAARIALVRDAAGDRDPELNLFIAAVAVTPAKPDLSLFLQIMPGATEELLLSLPSILVGSPHQIAERLHHFRETHGISYFGVLEDAMAAFAEVIPLLR